MLFLLLFHYIDAKFNQYIIEMPHHHHIEKKFIDLINVKDMWYHEYTNKLIIIDHTGTSSVSKKILKRTKVNQEVLLIETLDMIYIVSLNVIYNAITKADIENMQNALKIINNNKLKQLKHDKKNVD